MTSPFWFFGTQLRVVTDEQHPQDAYDLIEGLFPPGVETPLHLHTKYDELIYVLEGAFTLYTHAGTVTLRPGESAFVPRNTPHVVAASAQAVNRGLTIATPGGGFAKLIRAVGIAGTDEGVPPAQPNDMGLFIQLSQQTGDLILGAPGARPALRE